MQKSTFDNLMQFRDMCADAGFKAEGFSFVEKAFCLIYVNDEFGQEDALDFLGSMRYSLALFTTGGQPVEDVREDFKNLTNTMHKRVSTYKMGR